MVLLMNFFLELLTILYKNQPKNISLTEFLLFLMEKNKFQISSPKEKKPILLVLALKTLLATK